MEQTISVADSTIHPLERGQDGIVHSQIKEIFVSTLDEAIEKIPQDSVVTMDVDGTILKARESFRMMAPFRIIKFDDIRNTLIERFSTLKQKVEAASGNQMQVASNRVVLETPTKNVISNIFKFSLDRFLGSTNLAYIFQSAGFDPLNVHFGMNRQDFHGQRINGIWGTYIANLDESLDKLKMENKPLHLVVVADNLNVLGPLADERSFIRRTSQYLHEQHDWNFEDLEFTLITLQKRSPFSRILGETLSSSPVES